MTNKALNILESDRGDVLPKVCVTTIAANRTQESLRYGLLEITTRKHEDISTGFRHDRHKNGVSSAASPSTVQKGPGRR